MALSVRGVGIVRAECANAMPWRVVALTTVNTVSVTTSSVRSSRANCVEDTGSVFVANANATQDTRGMPVSV